MEVEFRLECHPINELYCINVKEGIDVESKLRHSSRYYMGQMVDMSRKAQDI